MDWVEARRQLYPALRVYHYASYEKTAMRRLAQQHSTREAVIDEWLRSRLRRRDRVRRALRHQHRSDDRIQDCS